MRFKDFIVEEALKRNYNDLIKNKSKNRLFDSIYFSLANKLGFKMLEEVQESTMKIENKEWNMWLNRYGYNTDGVVKKFLIYDQENKISYYFGEDGLLYTGNGNVFKLMPKEQSLKVYNNYKDFLSFVIKYTKENKKMVKQFMMIGYDKNYKYYLSTDGNFYYDDYISTVRKECTSEMNDKCQEYIESFEKMD